MIDKHVSSSAERFSVDLTVACTVEPALILALLAEFDVHIGSSPAKTPRCALVLADAGNYTTEIAKVLARGIRPVIVSLLDSDAADLAAALEQGADDAVLGTLDVGEIIVRLRTAVRRSAARVPNIIRIAGVEIEPQKRLVRRGNKEVTLSPTECALLLSVARREGDVVTSETLVKEIWGKPIQIATVHTYVSYLRRKVDDPARKSIVRTVRGVGYAIGS